MYLFTYFVFTFYINISFVGILVIGPVLCLGTVLDPSGSTMKGSCWEVSLDDKVILLV